MKVLHIAGHLAGVSVLIFFWLFCVEVLAAPVAQANDIYVNDTADNVISGDGRCTLREAVNNANANFDLTAGDCARGAVTPADVIHVPAGIYQLGVGVEDGNASGDLDIFAYGGDLTLLGAGQQSTIISGPGLVVGTDRLIHINPNTPGNITVNVRDLTLLRGITTGGGGGIFNNGATLVVEDCTLDENEAHFGRSGNQGKGGAIYNQGGSVALRRSALRHNLAATGVIHVAGGGAIYNTAGGSVGIEDSELIANTAQGIPGSGAQVSGGAIWNEGGSIMIWDTQVISNTATGGASGLIGNGGAFYHGASGYIWMAGGLIEKNRADESGGAVYTVADVSFTDTLIRQNQAEEMGGGLALYGGISYVTNSTVSDNQAELGGGIMTHGTVNLANVTLSGNSARDRGGGVYVFLGGELSSKNATVAGNVADADADNSGDGGGIYTVGIRAALHNTIVAGNVDRAAAGAVHADVSGAFISQGYNLIGDMTGATGFTSGANHDILGTFSFPVDTRLLPLGWYGGPTPTCSPNPGSPAINSGDPGDYVITDQRGVPRPQGAGPDIGAVEVRLLHLPLINRS